MSLPLVARCAFGHHHDLTKDRALPHLKCLHGCTVLWYAAPSVVHCIDPGCEQVYETLETHELCLQCGQTGFWA